MVYDKVYDKQTSIDNFNAVIICAKDVAGLKMMAMMKKYLDIRDLGGFRGARWSLGGYV